MDIEVNMHENLDKFEKDKKVEKGYLKVIQSIPSFEMSVGQPFPQEYTHHTPPSDYDVFYEKILTESAAYKSIGLAWSLGGGIMIGLAPVIKFGDEELKKEIAPKIFRGEASISLAISEPWAGSDVAGLKCTAVLDELNNVFVVNGSKKWITGGLWADWFTTAVRTSDKGMDGISMLVIPSNLPGVTVRHMKCQGVWASGTSYISFENVKVPKRYLIGEIDQGFKLIMFNFNHERLGLATLAEGVINNILKFTLAHIQNNNITDSLTIGYYNRILRYYTVFTT